MTTTVERPVRYRIFDTGKADDLYEEKMKERKWAEVVKALIEGQTLWVPGMHRVALESLRTIIQHRTKMTLHSRSMTIEGETGRMLRLGRKIGRSAAP